MSAALAEYPLRDGYVHNWLVIGPRVLTPDEPPAASPAALGGYPDKVVEALRFTLGEAALTWQYVRALDDHLLDLSAGWRASDSLETWAYCLVDSPADGRFEAVLVSYGPADVWHGTELVAGWPGPQQAKADRAAANLGFTVHLQQGPNVLAIRCLRPAVGEPTEARPNAVALRLLPTDAGAAALRVLIPVATTNLKDRAEYEAALEAAYLEREVYGRDQGVGMRWTAPQPPGMTFTTRFQSPAGLIYAEGFEVRANVETRRQIQEPGSTPDGPYHVRLMPDTRVYHSERRLRVSRALPVFIAGGAYAQTPIGDYATRRTTALQHAARREHDLYAEIAKLALGWSSRVNSGVIQTAIDTVTQRRDGYALALLGLLGLLHRFADAPGFQQDMRAALDACVLGFDFSPQQPAGEPSVLLLAAEVLAGQLYPDRRFEAVGLSGRQHQVRAEQAALALRPHTHPHGVHTWDSPETLHDEVVGWVHLLVLAENEALAGLASAVLDLRFFSLGLNSFQGTFGATHGRSGTTTLKSGRAEPTAGLAWLLWGLGTLNHVLEAVVALACYDAYDLPPVIQAIATDRPEELWSREGLGPQAAAAQAEPICRREVNKVTYKTPDYMLCSAQSYYPGEPGGEEHVWQATLGPDAVVFANQPAYLSQADAFVANFWRGNAVLPRVAQWHEALVALYTAPPGLGLGFTHAYFPVYAFDEYAVEQGWAFARKGDGYLALTAARGLSLITYGDGAYRELRSDGLDNIWLCQMGRAALDGSFAQFQARVLAAPPDFADLSARWTTLRGDTLEFGWEGPLTVNGQAQALASFKRFDNPYAVMERGAAQLEIVHGAHGLRLTFD